MTRRLVVLGLLLALAFPALAAVEVYRFDDPAKQERYKALIAELRCLVCQNQNLADSNADLAKDLRRQTYEMIQRGETDAQIIEYMVARYGDFVLYRPPFKSTTALLWIGPFVLLVAGVGVLLLVIRHQRRAAAARQPDPEARARARALLGEEEGERP